MKTLNESLSSNPQLLPLLRISNWNDVQLVPYFFVQYGTDDNQELLCTQRGSGDVMQLQ